MYPIGSISALIPEAADAGVSGATVADGESGDTDFPFGQWKVLAVRNVLNLTTLVTMYMCAISVLIFHSASSC